jgi:peptidoglycan/LPS O-acetylase OafA/YrhL
MNAKCLPPQVTVRRCRSAEKFVPADCRRKRFVFHRLLVADFSTDGHVGHYQMNYRPEVDGLRAVAVLAVIASHMKGVLPGGFLGVDVFFVISGYVITTSLAKHPYDSAGDFFLGFYARRVKRILPALLVCVLGTAFVGSLFVDPETPAFASSMKTGLFSLFGFSNVFLYFESVDYFGSDAHLNIFTHTWSLGVEEQFYFVFPLLFWLTGIGRLGSKGRVASLAFLTVASLVLFTLQNQTDPSAAYYLVFSRFWELSLGCLVAIVLGGPSLNVPAVPWFGVLTMGAAFAFGAEDNPYTTPAAVVGTAIIIATLGPRDVLYRVLTVKPVIWIGLISYSLYLWHWPVIAISRWTIGIDIVTAVPQLMLMFALAAMSYLCIEKPLRHAQWSSRLWLTIGYGLGGSAVVGLSIAALVGGYLGSLYTGSPVVLQAKGVQTLTEDKFVNGQLAWRPRNCILQSDREVGKNIGWDTCTIRTGASNNRQRKFLVIGNSYSAALFEMYSSIAEQGLGTVVATSSWGASQVAGVPNRTPWSKANDYYWTVVVPRLTARLGAGDTVLMISDNSRYVIARPNAKTKADLAALQYGLLKFAGKFESRGISVYYLSQLSIMRDSRCTPDMAKRQWFERDNKGRCRFRTRDYVLSRTKPLRAVLAHVAAARENFHVLDFFPQFCPEKTCRFSTPEGVVLFRDVWSHPSIEANLMLRPLFLQAVAAQ